MVEKWELERVCFLLVRISNFFVKKGLHLNLMYRNIVVFNHTTFSLGMTSTIFNLPEDVIGDYEIRLDGTNVKAYILGT